MVIIVTMGVITKMEEGLKAYGGRIYGSHQNFTKILTLEESEW